MLNILLSFAAGFGSVELHDYIMFYFFIILQGVGMILTSVITRFRNLNNLTNALYYKYNYQGTILEIIGNLTPATELIGISLPVLLLLLQDVVIDPAMTVKALGHL
jgi:heme/copper-type cytochrome/quinol oxidase subunit 2